MSDTITLTIERKKLITITGDHGGYQTGRCVVCGAHGWLGKIEHGDDCPVGRQTNATPAAKWRENGEPDPFEGQRYDEERALLCKGGLTDDEIANEVFLRPNIGNTTAAKERIRWLSRALEKALKNTN